MFDIPKEYTPSVTKGMFIKGIIHFIDDDIITSHYYIFKGLKCLIAQFVKLELYYQMKNNHKPEHMHIQLYMTVEQR